MRPRIVSTIARKELLESFRDRKTLFLMIFLPILLYPLLILVITQVAIVQQGKLAEKTSTIIVANAEPDHPFVAHLAGLDRLELIGQDAAGAAPRLDPDSAQAILDLSEWPSRGSTGRLRAEIAFTSVDEASRQAVDRLEEALTDYAAAETKRRLRARGIEPATFEPVIEPVVWELTDESPPKQRGGYALGAFLPILVIAMVLLGAYYPAIDLTAGEKERGSIQTLFTAPITPLEIVAGKYIAVLCIALVSGLANLLGIVLIFSQNLFMSGAAMEGLAIDFTIGPGTAGALFVVILLMAAFFSALLLTVAVLARSYKEGQTYITPIYMASFLPAVVAQMPGFELTPQLALVPAVNVTLLMKQVLVEGVALESMFLVAVSTLVFTALVLALAGRLFAQEQVILGERGSLSLLDRRRPDAVDRRPTLGEGLAWYGVLFVVLFYLGAALQSRHLYWGLAATLWLLLLAPTLGFSRYLRLDLRRTFNLRRPGGRALVAAAVLGACAWIVVAWLNQLVEQHVLQTPPELQEAMSQLLPGGQSAGAWVGLLLLVAVSPAICEEAFFRGFLFSSLRGRVAPWALVTLTAVLFGVFHLSIYRLFGTTVLGVIMALLVYKSGSIWTSALFHALSNGAVLVIAALFTDQLVTADGLPPWLLAVGLLGTVIGLALLMTIRSPWAADRLVTTGAR